MKKIIVRPTPQTPERIRRKVALKRIRDARDRALRQMGARPGGPGANRAAAVFALVAMVLLGAGLVGASGRGRATKERRTPESDVRDTRRAMETLATAFAHFEADCGRYPTTDEGLLALISQTGVPDWCGPYVNRVPSDAWNRGYLYTCENGVPSLRSAGPDKTFRTADDLVVPREAFRCHPDFRPHDPTRLEKVHSFSVSIGAEGRN